MLEYQFLITEQDIQQYAEISGDDNPIHLDEGLAKHHGFSGKVAHGMLTMVSVWRILSIHLLTSTDFPNDYELDFHTPVYAGDMVILQVKHTANRLRIEGHCKGKLVVKGWMIIA